MAQIVEIDEAEHCPGLYDSANGASLVAVSVVDITDECPRVAAVRRAKDERKKERVHRGIVTREVSDHALVRYLERCKGFDVEALRSELRLVASEATPSKDGELLWHPSGVGLVMGQDGRIVTVLGAEQITKWTQQTPGV